MLGEKTKAFGEAMKHKDGLHQTVDEAASIPPNIMYVHINGGSTYDVTLSHPGRTRGRMVIIDVLSAPTAVTIKDDAGNTIASGLSAAGETLVLVSNGLSWIRIGGFGAAGAGGIVALRGAVVEKTTQTALTDTATVTAAQLLTKVLDGTPTAAATYTLPTAALLVAAMPGAAVGDSFTFIVNNKSSGANTITVAAGSGGTGDGGLTVAQNKIKMFFVIITNVTASSEAYFVYGIDPD